MALPLLSLITILPALLALLVGSWVVRIFRSEDRALGWVFYLLLVSTAMMVPYVIFASTFRTGGAGYLLIILLPAAVGILALIFYHWRDLFALWGRMKVLVSGLILGLLFLLALTVIGEPFTPLVIVLPSLMTAVLYGLCRRMGKTVVWVFSAALAGLLMLDALGILGAPFVFSMDWSRQVYSAIGLMFPALVFPCAAALLERGLESPRSEMTEDGLIYYGLMGILLLSMAAAVFRHGVLVDATGHAAEDRMPFTWLAFAIVAAMLLYVTLNIKERFIPALGYMFLAPAIVMFSFAASALVDPYAVTVRRAERIDRAIQEYRQMASTYPTDLGEISPNYLIILPGPLTGRGQVWCYQGGADYYRLGFAYHQRYYSDNFEPHSEIITTSSEGELPTEIWMCDRELERIKETGGL